MASKMLSYNCGAYVLGGWTRRRPTENELKLAEQEVEILIENVKAGWCKIIIATLLKEQEPFRAILRKHGFKKTPEAKSKYDDKNTQCIYYFDSNCLKTKEKRCSLAQTW